MTVTDQPLSKRAVVRGARTVALARVGALIEVVAQPAYTWLFGLATYGLYTALWAAVNIASNAADLALTSALQRAVPQAADDDQAHAAVKAALVMGMLPSVAIALLVSVFATDIAALFNAAPADQPTLTLAVALFAWALPLWTFVELATSAVRARGAFGPEVRLRIFWEQAARLVLALLLWAAGVRALGLVVAHLASLGLTALLAVRLLGRCYDLKRLLRVPVPRSVVRGLLRTGAGLLPANIAQRLFIDLPPVLLNLLLPGAAGASAAGLFGIARKISTLPLIVRHSLHYVIQPLAAGQAVRDPTHINPVYGFATRLSLILLAPLALLLCLVADELLLLFAPEARAAATIVIILTAARGLSSVAGPANAILQVLHPERWPLVNAVVGLSVWAALTALLWPQGAALAMAWGVAAGLAAMEGLAALQLWSEARLHPGAPPFARLVCVVAAGGLAAALLVQLAAGAPPVAQTALAVALTAALAWLAALSGLTQPERAALGRTGRRLGLAPRLS